MALWHWMESAKHEGDEMKFFIDTANVSEIRPAAAMGMADGVTTNPSLMAKEGGDAVELLKEITTLVAGPVSAEVISLDAEGMVKEARSLAMIAENIVVKIPMTEEGMKAVCALAREGIRTNVTLIFSPLQALMAAKAGADYVSPFVGRLDDLAQEGMLLVEQIGQIFANYDFSTEIIVASIRNLMQVLDAALVGAHVATLPYEVFSKLASHPMTDKGIQSFMADWQKVHGN